MMVSQVPGECGVGLEWIPFAARTSGQGLLTAVSVVSSGELKQKMYYTAATIRRALIG